MQINNWKQFLNENISDKNRGLLLKNNKKFWIGTANVLDGEIEEIHTYEKARSYDFHHSFYFSHSQIEKITNEECVVFWVNDDVVCEWRHGKAQQKLIDEIKKQIVIV